MKTEAGNRAWQIVSAIGGIGLLWVAAHVYYAFCGVLASIGR